MTDTPSRTDRYMARVKEQLSTLADDAARRLFLAGQIDTWEFHYTRFQILQARPEWRPSQGLDEPMAFDYSATIAALGALRATYERKAA